MHTVQFESAAAHSILFFFLEKHQHLYNTDPSLLSSLGLLCRLTNYATRGGKWRWHLGLWLRHRDGSSIRRSKMKHWHLHRGGGYFCILRLKKNAKPVIRKIPGNMVIWYIGREKMMQSRVSAQKLASNR